MGITAARLKTLGLIDRIVTEPVGGAHRDYQAVATSSVSVHRWAIKGRAVHHLLDPRTGEPATGGLLSVTVAGPDPAWAEVWSKVLFIAGLADIAQEARSRGLAAWWVADDGTLEMTADARRGTVWVASEDDPSIDTQSRQGR